MRKVLKFIFLFVCTLCLLVMGLAGGGLYYLVVVEPGSEIEEENINTILGRESPVFYRDGATKLGVLFKDYHRQYVPYEKIPGNFVHAIVAAEDDQFFTHCGIDLSGIVRAFIANLKAGRVVQGGSTLTQQTAKNLFKRNSRSYKAKLKELLYALRLEHRYSKEKILEFYSNQFFVSGNGHGLGVAARYYFDKDVSELNLLECAFIAGSVQRPNYYNPFTKHNWANPDAVREKIDKRLRYVLDRMLAKQTINAQVHASALAGNLQFNRGKMRFRVNTAMDLVRDGLASDAIVNALEEHGISNVSTSGIRIVTSLDNTLNRKALEAMRLQLSYLGMCLEGYERDAVQSQYEEIKYAGDRELVSGSFLFGEVLEVSLPGHGEVVAWISLPGSARALLDRKGLDRAVAAITLYNRGLWHKTEPEDREGLIQQLAVNDTVYVRLREQNEEGIWLVDLERYPAVNGGALVLQKGMIRAMVGGMTDQHYNRAIDAKRLMGSIFKPFLFAAAMQLGWNPLDLLDNRRDAFIFMGRPYFPRPDHHSPHDFVTMSWAGVQSENVAAVWLLYHLLDHLSRPDMVELARQLDMAPRVQGGITEPYEQYRARIRDRYGIVMNRKAISRAAFEKAKRTLRPDFYFDGRIRDYQRLIRLHDGTDFDRFQEDLTKASGALQTKGRKELELRLAILAENYHTLKRVQKSLEQYRVFVQALGGKGQMILFDYPTHLPPRPEGLLVRDQEGQVHYTLKNDLPEGWRVVSLDRIREHLDGLNREQRERFWQSVQLEHSVTYESLVQFTRQIEMEEKVLYSQRPYSLDVLSETGDFRVMLGLRYLVSLARQCGIESDLEPVLSFPLGSNVITLFEATQMYETLVTGKRYQVEGRKERDAGQPDFFALTPGRAIIERIEGPDGEVIYHNNGQSRSVLDRKVTAAVANILYNTVTHGTGRYARKHTRLHSDNQDRERELAGLDLPVPLLGKTGTANRYRNAAFLGVVPILTGTDHSQLSVEKGYAVGVYVGYDENIAMTRKNLRVSGSRGALPAWTAIAEALLQAAGTGDLVDPIDLAFNGLPLEYVETGQVFIPVEPDSGGRPIVGSVPVAGTIAPERPSSLTYGRQGVDGQFEPKRFFQPYWKTVR